MLHHEGIKREKDLQFSLNQNHHIAVQTTSASCLIVEYGKAATFIDVGNFKGSVPPEAAKKILLHPIRFT